MSDTDSSSCILRYNLVAGSAVTYTEGSGVFAGGLVMTVAASVVKI